MVNLFQGKTSPMPKLQTFLCFIFLTLSSYSQDKVSVYKSKADNIVANYFDKSFISRIKCTDVAIYGLDSIMIYFADFEQARNRRDRISTITFFYSFYSKKLNYLLDFEVTIAGSKRILDDTTLVAKVPTCIAKNIDCNFITKDSAIKIAIKDSISYPKNIGADLYRHYKSFNYYWFVRSAPIVKKSKRRSATKRGSRKQERIINAITGEIISHKDYYEQ